MKEIVLTVEEVGRLLSYNEFTGDLIWRVNRGGKKVGDVAGCMHSGGYRQVSINGTLYLSHRVALLLHNGVWPPDQVDHKNHVRDDNRINNLRMVSSLENCRNQELRGVSRSGVTGVYWYKAYSNWTAQIMVRGRNIFLGYFDDKRDAIAARKAAEITYGFHRNHGLAVANTPLAQER